MEEDGRCWSEQIGVRGLKIWAHNEGEDTDGKPQWIEIEIFLFYPVHFSDTGMQACSVCNLSNEQENMGSKKRGWYGGGMCALSSPTLKPVKQTTLFLHPQCVANQSGSSITKLNVSASCQLFSIWDWLERGVWWMWIKARGFKTYLVFSHWF